MEIISTHRCFDGTLGYYKHRSKATNCEMRFSVFVPDKDEGEKCPTLFFLSGLTCTEENFTTKAGAYKTASELGLIIVVPDTSPRGEDVPTGDSYDLGKGASFYVNATEDPWQKHYQMETYITQELRELVTTKFPADKFKLGIFGHSMGGHGALVLYLRNPGLYKSISAFAPIAAPTQTPWGEKAFAAYLGSDKTTWGEYDATELMKNFKVPGAHPMILIDQGSADQFLPISLKPWLFEEACSIAGHALELRIQDDYDHGYFFIQTFIDDHLRHHAAYLT